MDFVLKANEGEAESIVLLIFVLRQCFNRRWVRGSGGGAESFVQGQLKLNFFPDGILAKALCMTHSGMLYRLDISTFYFYEPLLF